MLTVGVYDTCNLIALQGLDTDDIEDKTSGDMEKLMACVGAVGH